MSILRFPNPGSDINKFISTFSTVYSALRTTTNFTHDDVRDALIKVGLVSSSGAIGEEAVRRSVRPDRSRDPLYNQVKMYSELYRMLGWYKPGTMNTNFNFTELSEYVATSVPEIQRRLFEECLLSIVFPNPHVENRGGNSIRPFPLILKMALKLENVIFRDEIIISVLNLANDTTENCIRELSNSILNIRGDLSRLLKAKQELARATSMQENTLSNYTRFPLGSLKATGWFLSDSINDIYDSPIIGYRMTELGQEKAKQLYQMVDIRHNDLAEFDIGIRASFTLLSHYVFLERCGFNISHLNKMLDQTIVDSSSILTKFGIKSCKQIFYSPIQQSTPEEIDCANELEIKSDL